MPDPEQVRLFEQADPDLDWKLFSTGVHVWVGQTYLRLKQAGYPVSLGATVPDFGLVVTHADHVTAVLRQRRWGAPITIVAARADRPRQPYADIEVVQNAGSANTDNAFHIQHWPQPGLIARDPQRGNVVRTVAFKGTVGEMTPEFATPEWAQRLRRQGIEWQCDAVAWGGNSATYQTSWNDYSDTDVIVAMRKDLSHLHAKKPASKLINAWLAGVPAILGPELAYRELRRSSLDYIEVASAAEAAAALDRLASDPELYRAMVDNGRQRSTEIMAQQCTAAWARLLFETIPARRAPAPVMLARLGWRGMRCRLSAWRSGRAS